MNFEIISSGTYDSNSRGVSRFLPEDSSEIGLVKTVVSVSVDLFGTLVDVDDSFEPATELRNALQEFDISVPGDWSEAYRESHVFVDDGEELSLVDHVHAALGSRGVTATKAAVETAVQSTFTQEVETRDGARTVVETLSKRESVGICSNCAVPGLVDRTIRESALDGELFDAVVTSVDCGWRKPNPRIFEKTASKLGCAVEELVHIGDDPHSDGGIEKVGGRAVLLTEHDLAAVPALLEGR